MKSNGSTGDMLHLLYEADHDVRFPGITITLQCHATVTPTRPRGHMSVSPCRCVWPGGAAREGVVPPWATAQQWAAPESRVSGARLSDALLLPA